MNKLITSTQAGVAPIAAELKDGQLAVNTADDIIYSLDDGGEVKKVDLLATRPMPECVYKSLSDMQSKVMAASGVLEWGWNRSVATSINKGLLCYEDSVDWVNSMAFGTSVADVDTGSKTTLPVLNVAGSRIVISGNVGRSDGANQIKFPPAPNGAQSNELDYGTEIDPKYGDVAADTDEAIARCFEGEVKNGDFRFGDDGSWGIISNVGLLSVASGVATVTRSVTGWLTLSQAGVLEEGVEYYAEVRVESLESSGVEHLRAYWGAGGKVLDISNLPTTFKFKFVAGTSAAFQIQATANDVSEFSVSYVSVRPTSNPVVLNRQDYWFTEVFDELIEEKDIFVPNAMVQWTSPTWNGMPLSTAYCPDEYAAYFKGDTTKGYFAVWSTMSDEQKASAWGDPNNHIRQLEDGRLVQRRVRIRTVAGKEGSWEIGLDARAVLDGDYGTAVRTTANNFMRLQGLKDSVPEFGIDDGTIMYTYGLQGNHTTNIKGVVGSTHVSLSYNGFCVAVPGGLVTRYNQGAYHPVLNPHGTGNMVHLDQGGNAPWYDDSVADNMPNTTKDCFDTSYGVNSHARAGFYGSVAIGVSVVGRPDGRFFDVIYAANVKDERLSTRVRPKVDVLEEFTHKAISGDVRGWEKQPFLTPCVVDTNTGNTSYSFINKPDGSRLNLDDIAQPTINIPTGVTGPNGADARGIGFCAVNEATKLHYISGGSVYANGTSNGVVDGDVIYVSLWLDIPVQEHTWTDIIGDPARIAATFPDGVIGQWIPVIPDGLGKNWPLNRKSLSSSVTNVYSIDDGATWTDISSPLNTTINARESVPLAADNVALYIYATPTHFTEDADNSKVLALGDVFAGAWYNPLYGASLVSSLIGEVPTNSDSRSLNVYQRLSVLDGGSRGAGALDEASYGYPRHYPLEAPAPNNDSKGSKVLFSLTDVNGLIHVQCHYRELDYDAGWGDDEFVHIEDDQTTMLDTNGNTVLVGTATFPTPFIYVENEEA